MGYDKNEHYRDCNICGMNYVYMISNDHDSFNYHFDYKYECPKCSKGLYVKKNKEILDGLKISFNTLVANGEDYYTKSVDSENKLITKVNLVLKSMPSNRVRSLSSDVVTSLDNGKLVEIEGTHYYGLISCYKTTFGLKKDTVYKSLIDCGLYNKSITMFKKEHKGINGVDVFLSFYGLTIDEYYTYIDLNKSKKNRTETYQNQYNRLIEDIEKAEKDYTESLNIYNKYHKKEARL